MSPRSIPTPDSASGKSGLAGKLPILVILAVAIAGAIMLRDQLSFAALPRTARR